MPTLRIPVLLALCLCAGGASADEPLRLPWETDKPAAPAPAPAAAAPGAGSLAEVVALLLPPNEARSLAEKPAERREELAARELEVLRRQDVASHALLMRRVTFARAELAEPGTGLSARGRALILLGPPMRRHVEPERAWAGRAARAHELANVRAVIEAGTPPVAGAPAYPSPPEAPALTLTGTLPTEAWVHPIPGQPDKARVLWFVDDDRDGTFRLVLDEVVDASSEISSVPGQVLPADLHAQLGLGATFEDLPAVSQDALPLTIEPSYFLAAQGKTFARVVVVVDPDHVEPKLAQRPVDFQVGSSVALRVLQAGTPLFQRVIPPGKGALASLGRSWGAEFGVPLLPGEYDVVAVVADQEGRGGRLESKLTVPALASGLALSTPVLALADGGSLPKAPEGATAPFQVGSYVVRPRVPPVFRRGETLALAVQVYGAPRAHLEFDLYLNGQLQGTFAEVDPTQLPATEIQLVDVVPEWPDGSYEIRVTANVSGQSAAGVTQRVTFRVQGGE